MPVQTRGEGKALPEQEPESRTLQEVLVTAPAKTRVELLPLDVTVLSDSVIVHSTESSLLPVLTDRVAGLFTSERGFAGYGVSGGAAGTVNIRGVGQGNKVLFMIDGQPQWASVFGHALPDTYVANGIERVEVVKGPSSLLYGSNAMGGLGEHHHAQGDARRAVRPRPGDVRLLQHAEVQPGVGLPPRTLQHCCGRAARPQQRQPLRIGLLACQRDGQPWLRAERQLVGGRHRDHDADPRRQPGHAAESPRGHVDVHGARHGVGLRSRPLRLGRGGRAGLRQLGAPQRRRRPRAGRRGPRLHLPQQRLQHGPDGLPDHALLAGQRPERGRGLRALGGATPGTRSRTRPRPRRRAYASASTT